MTAATAAGVIMKSTRNAAIALLAWRRRSESSQPAVASAKHRPQTPSRACGEPFTKSPPTGPTPTATNCSWLTNQARASANTPKLSSPRATLKRGERSASSASSSSAKAEPVETRDIEETSKEPEMNCQVGTEDVASGTPGSAKRANG